MLHLAQVEKEPASSKGRLRLIARQQSEYAWTIITMDEFVPAEDLSAIGHGALVLVTLSETLELVRWENADRWLITLIQTFLKTGITPNFLQEEAERAEQWRQTLTLQSQDLDRRALELEARREQIEQLEETLKREKKQMETLATQYKEQTQELEQRLAEIAALQARIDQLEATLKQFQSPDQESATRTNSTSSNVDA